jgi:hypothetical protein
MSNSADPTKPLLVCARFRAARIALPLLFFSSVCVHECAKLRLFDDEITVNMRFYNHLELVLIPQEVDHLRSRCVVVVLSLLCSCTTRSIGPAPTWRNSSNNSSPSFMSTMALHVRLTTGSAPH